MPLFSFKSRLKDFVVDEQLPFHLQQKGNFFLIQIEKENVTTVDLVDYCSKSLKVPKSAIGYAGLKDKFAITRQRLSFDVNQIMKKFPEKEIDKLIISSLRRACTTLKYGWSDKALTIKDDLTNHFTITLRAKKKLLTNDKEHIEYVLNKLFSKPIPNYFGEQRFGIKGQNVDQAWAILSGEDRTTSGFDRHFKLQAFASYIFNQMLERRLKLGMNPIDGDLLMIDKKLYLFDEGRLYEQQDRHKKQNFFVTAINEGRSVRFEASDYQIMLPVLGYNALISPTDTQMGSIANNFMRHFKVSPVTWKLYKDLEIYGILRNVWVSPLKPSRERDDNNLILKFALQAGAYASVVVDRLQIMIYETPRRKNAKPGNRQHLDLSTPSSLRETTLEMTAGLNLAKDDVKPQHKEQRKRKIHRKGQPKPKI